MNHHEDYKGHSFTVNTNKRGNGFVWEYLIDGTIHRQQMGDRPMAEQIALSEGIDAAKSAIDRMPKAK